MWLSELEKGMTVWFYGRGDPWNVYTGIVKGWTAEAVYLEQLSFHTITKSFSMPISSVSAEPLEAKPSPGIHYVV